MTQKSCKSFLQGSLCEICEVLASYPMSSGAPCRISFCSVDASFDRVVAFIGTHSNQVMECHAFLCAKRRAAQVAALTISKAFQVAYQA
ncbi:hypothetical protein MRX96_000413 [Rhipicephalus microplus]